MVDRRGSDFGIVVVRIVGSNDVGLGVVIPGTVGDEGDLVLGGIVRPVLQRSVGPGDGGGTGADHLLVPHEVGGEITGGIDELGLDSGVGGIVGNTSQVSSLGVVSEDTETGRSKGGGIVDGTGLGGLGNHPAIVGSEGDGIVGPNHFVLGAGAKNQDGRSDREEESFSHG